MPQFDSGDFKKYDKIFDGLGYELGSVPQLSETSISEDETVEELAELSPKEEVSKPQSVTQDDLDIDEMLSELDNETMGAVDGLESESLDLGYSAEEEPQQEQEILQEVFDQPSVSTTEEIIDQPVYNETEEVSAEPEPPASEEVIDQPVASSSEDMSDFLKELETSVSEPSEEASPQIVEEKDVLNDTPADSDSGDLDLDELLKAPTEDFSIADDSTTDADKDQSESTQPSEVSEMDDILSDSSEGLVFSDADASKSEDTVPDLADDSTLSESDTDLDALLGLPEEPSVVETKDELGMQDDIGSGIPDEGMDLDSILAGESIAEVSQDESLQPQDETPQIFEDIAPTETVPDDSELELSDNDLIKIQNKILTLTPKLQDVARRTIIDETVSKIELNALVRMLLVNKSTDEIRAYLENILGIDLTETTAQEEVFSEDFEKVKRPSYIKESLLPLVKVAVLVFVVGLLAFLIYKSFIEPQVEGKGYFVRGIKKINSGQYAEAEDNFKKGEVKLGKKLKWYNKFGLEYRKNKEYKRAIKKFRAGLKIEPDDFNTTINLVETYTKFEKYDKAQNIYRQLLSKYPDNLKVFESLGDLYMFLGDKKKDFTFYKKANRTYNKIINRSWENLNGQFKVLLSHIKMDELDHVKKKYQQVLAIKKNAYNSGVLTELAGYYQKKNMWHQSSKILKRIIATDNNNDIARFYASRFFRHNENYKMAIENLQYSIKYSKNKAVYHNELGEIYMLLSEPNTALALESFKKAIELEPRYYKPYINRADIYYERLAPGVGGDLNLQDSNYDQARWNYEMAEKNLPKDFSNIKFFYNLGWLYYRKGMVETALNKWKNVYDKNPFHPVASFVMGNAYLHLKKTDLAIAEYSKVIEYYKEITKKIHRVVSYKKRHKNVYGNLSYAYNNIGIAYERKYQKTKNINWEKRALLSFWKARKLSEQVGQLGAQYPKYNLKYILRRNVKRKGMAIAPEQRKFNIAKTLYYETY